MVPLDVDDDDGGSVGLPNWSVPTTVASGWCVLKMGECHHLVVVDVGG